MSNPYILLSNMVDSVEKLAMLPENEVIQNKTLVTEIVNAFSTHNIDSIINAASREIQEIKNRETAVNTDTNQLLRAYAIREHDRVKNKEADKFESFITKIVRADNALKDKPLKASAGANNEFSSVFNSVYANGAIKINTSTDPTVLSTYMDYSPYRINYVEYLAMPILSEMVDRPIAIALKKFPYIDTKNDKFDKAIEKAIRRKNIKNVIKDALFYSDLSPRGSLVVPIQRDDYITFNVFNDTQFSYGIGSSYSGITQPYTPMRVGDLYCMGAKLRHGVSAFFTCPGFEPLFGIGINRIPQLRTAAEAWNLYIHVIKILLVRAQVLIEKMQGDIQTDTMLSKMRAQLQRISQTMGVGTPIEQARGMELDILNNNISDGTSAIAGPIKEFIAAVRGVAPEYFFGGGTATYSQAAFQIHSTNEYLHSHYQVDEIEPLYRFMVNTLIKYDADFKDLGVKEDEYDIGFESIYEETEQEKVDLIAKRTETLIRQRMYPELEEAFKQEDLLSEDIELPQDIPDRFEDGSNTDEDQIDDDSPKSILTSPLSNTKGEYDPDQLRMGIEIEKEHTNDPEVAEKIAKDHLDEIPDYYTYLIEMEKKAKAENYNPKIKGGYESPEPGDLPEKGKEILASTYAACRKDGGDKEKCAKIAWGAVRKAGF
jgi:hypothetical protein